MKKVEKQIIKLANAWVVLANVSEGDWTKQTKEWQEAAVCWRDNYFKAITEARLTSPNEKGYCVKDLYNLAIEKQKNLKKTKSKGEIRFKKYKKDN